MNAFSVAASTGFGVCRRVLTAGTWLIRLQWRRSG